MSQDENHIDQVVVRQVARAERMKRVLIVAIAFLVTIALVLIVWLIAEVRSTQQTGSPTLRAIAEQQDDIERAANASSSLNDAALDCLTPGGKCYRESRRRSAETIASVAEITYYAAVCADRPGSQSLRAIRICVADLITAARPAVP
jgi:hypothetical protein